MYIKIQNVLTVAIPKASLSILFRGTLAICSENHIKINSYTVWAKCRFNLLVTDFFQILAHPVFKM